MFYPLLLLASTAALVSLAQPVLATPAIEAKARAVSIEIKLTKADRVGSGVIIHRQDVGVASAAETRYTLVTNRHVICGSSSCQLQPQETYTLTTADGQRHMIPGAGVKFLGRDVDLAIIQFRSRQIYPVATVAAATSLQVDDAVYTAGFPRKQGFAFGQGKARAVVNRRLTGDYGGYTVIYDAPTLPGMSGGGAFDRQGRLVAIHGYGDRFTVNTDHGVGSAYGYAKPEVGGKIGYNRGIPVHWAVQGLKEHGIDLGQQALPAGAGAVTQADEFFIAGFNQWVDPGMDGSSGRRQAVQLFSQAIASNPNYAVAYFLRAMISSGLGDYTAALADYNRAITLDPNYALAYNNRGNLRKDRLQDVPGALTDYNRAIAIDPAFTFAYINRGLLKATALKDTTGALADYNQAISLNPNLAGAYNNRGILKADQLQDTAGALADYNKALSLNPDDVLVYSNRGTLKYQKFNDVTGALADYNQAIALDPNYALAYSNRGNIKTQKLQDHQGALADYNKAIALDPSYAQAYYNRGILKVDRLQDIPGALADYNKAIALDPQNADAYYNRGLLKHANFSDVQGTLADYNQAITLNPSHARAYSNRGLLKYEQLQDVPGALADLDRAIALDPKLAPAYTNRGMVKYLQLKDAPGALADFDRAIALDATYALAYGHRALLRTSLLNDRPGAIADLRRAAQLFRAQGDRRRLQLMLDVLQSLGATE